LRNVVKISRGVSICRVNHNKNAPEFIGKHFSSQEANFVSATMFLGVDKLGNIDRKQNVSVTMFPSLPRA
jgi:hypothetical protein